VSAEKTVTVSGRECATPDSKAAAADAADASDCDDEPPDADADADADAEAARLSANAAVLQESLPAESGTSQTLMMSKLNATWWRQLFVNFSE